MHTGLTGPDVIGEPMNGRAGIDMKHQTGSPNGGRGEFADEKGAMIEKASGGCKKFSFHRPHHHAIEGPSPLPPKK
jgi:hypothetical protein